MSFPSNKDFNQKTQTLVQTCLEYVDKAGVEASVNLVLTEGHSVSVQEQQAESFLSHADFTLSMSLNSQSRNCSLFTKGEDWGPIQAAIDEALLLLTQASPDEAHGLPDHDWLQAPIVEVPAFEPFEMSFDQLLEEAFHLERHGLAWDKRIIKSRGAQIAYLGKKLIYSDTRGRQLTHAYSSWSKSCALVGEHNGSMEIQGEYDLKCSKKDLKPCEVLAREAAEKVIHSLGRVSLLTKAVDVLLTPECAAHYLQMILSALAGEAIYAKRSFLRDRLFQKILPEEFDLIEHPHLPFTFSSRPFDLEGIPTQNKTLFKEGAPTQYLLDSFTARKLKYPARGHALSGGVTTCFLSSGKTVPFSELIQTFTQGLLVTEIQGEHFDPATGLFSDSVAGFWVENGVVTYPVAGISIAGDINNWKKDLVAASNASDERISIRCGHLWIKNLQLAGQSV